MMSPIAVESFKESRLRPVKGTGRRRTEYKRPPVVKLIAMVGSIQALGRLRGALAYGAFRGTINPSEKTEREWERAFWTQVCTIMLRSRNPSFVYNEVLRWAKPAWAEEMVKLSFELQCKSMP